jgi:hypothetical protein
MGERVQELIFKVFATLMDWADTDGWRREVGQWCLVFYVLSPAFVALLIVWAVVSIAVGCR